MLWSAVLSLAAASPLLPPKVLNLDVTKHDIPDDIVKRDTWSASFGSKFNQPCYLVELELGTPRKSARMWLDTGSYSAWVREEYYNYTDSSTSTKGSDDYSVGYIGGGVDGFWVQDTASLTNGWEFPYKFGQINGLTGYFSYFDGLMGIAPYTLESDPDNQGIINALYRENHINSRSFGLWLGSQGNGTLAFGGIDTAKFHGELTVVPFWPGGGFGLPVQGWYGFDIHGNRIKLAEGGEKCAIDTGVGVATLPTPFVDAFKRAFNVTQAGSVPEAIAQGFDDARWVIKYQGHAGYSIDVAGLILDFPMEHWLEEPDGTNLKGNATIGKYYGLNIKTGGCLMGSHHFFHNYYVAADYDHTQFAIAPAVQQSTWDGSSELKTIGPEGFAEYKSAPSMNATTERDLTAFTTYFPYDSRATQSA